MVLLFIGRLLEDSETGGLGGWSNARGKAKLYSPISVRYWYFDQLIVGSSGFYQGFAAGNRPISRDWVFPGFRDSGQTRTEADKSGQGIRMKGVCFQGIRQVATQQVHDPVLQSPGDAIVQVRLAGLCGSDLHPYYGRETGLDPGTVMGHEFVGEVVEAGTDVPGLSPGTMVGAPFTTSCGSCFYCQRGLFARCSTGQLFGWREAGRGLHGGQAEYVRVPHAAGTLVPLQGLPPEIGLLLGDNLSTGYFCAEMAETGPQGVYAVIGCGTVGLLCVMSCLTRGVEQLYAFDPQSHRLQQARQLGASTFDNEEAFVTAIAEATGGRGADAVMELVGLPDAQTLAFRVMRPGGIMSVVGCHCTPDFAFSPVDAFDKNLTYRTGRCPARYYFDRLGDVIDRFHDQLLALFTHRFSLDNSVTAYDVFANRKDGCIKAAFDTSL
jgi:threonine dehydrogenase-like Zn-dependent dehydrogenase